MCEQIPKVFGTYEPDTPKITVWDFFAWLHFAVAKRNQDIHVRSSFRIIEISHTSSLSRNLLQGFFLNASAAFARTAHKSVGRRDKPNSTGSPTSRKFLLSVPAVSYAG
ncbi:hypothetical protein NC796_08075 [Aliifodinibius sp. S!AR15-10]|uniref:hypothetical protein n=1 Tax=Aliifodinibius sp. S!AR15-10 TaxID=2950437 RepID=UPI002861789C|nr:hypothetical protein [Aliifodinibius sp. S!AR15-10]MDR8391090.1 hypothetical protein [Aliifodinibius sp. S!AR15-10]